MLRYHFLLALPLILLSSCMADLQEPGDQVPPPPVVNFTDDQLAEIATGLESDLSEGDGAFLNQSLDYVQFLKRIVWPRTPNQKETDEFIAAVTNASGSGVESTLGGKLVGQMQRGDGVKFLRVVRDDGGVRLLYRVNGGDGAVNYIEMLVGQSEEGKPAIVDLYIAASGENLSQSVGRMEPASGKGLLARLLTSANNDGKETLKAINKMSELTVAGKHEEVLAYFDALPEKVQREKMIQLGRIRAGTNIADDERYAVMLDDFRKLYPQDPSLDLLLIDYYIIQTKYDSALAAIDRLDGRFKDPYLNYHRSLVNVAKGEYGIASEQAENLIARDSTSLDPYTVLLSIAMQKEDDIATATTMERMLRNGAGTISFEVVETDSSFAYFADSKEYKRLKRKYAGE